MASSSAFDVILIAAETAEEGLGGNCAPAGCIVSRLPDLTYSKELLRLVIAGLPSATQVRAD
jgi:hypothetical protein